MPPASRFAHGVDREGFICHTETIMCMFVLYNFGYEI
jgi:hypothetical protein